MTSVVFFASRSHYAEHLWPVVNALPHATVAGIYGTTPARWGDPAREMPDHVPVVVASAVDAQRFTDRPVIHLDHGAGQTYPGDPRSAESASYPGGAGLEHVRLFLCPNEHVANAWTSRYPNTPAVAVGCPRLDQHHGTDRSDRATQRVAFVFHWDCRLIPETRTGWKFWREPVGRFVMGRPGGVYAAGHAHPRAPQIASSMVTMKWPTITGVDKLLDWADVIVADNTSVLYEACALGLSTVVLNAPWYRRDVEHGMRFWSHPPGPMIDDPDELPGAIRQALDHPATHAPVRRAAAVRAYGGMVDGSAAGRAAAAILDVLG